MKEEFRKQFNSVLREFLQENKTPKEAERLYLFLKQEPEQKADWKQYGF